MKNEIRSYKHNGGNSNQELFEVESHFHQSKTDEHVLLNQYHTEPSEPGELLVITSYPPRECGIATYSQDLIKALNNKFSNSMSLKVCALESGDTNFEYPSEVDYTLKTSIASDYERLSRQINKNRNVQIVFVQHEFGFFKEQETAFLKFLVEISKPVVIVFHTVLPHPSKELKLKIQNIAAACSSVIVMTHISAGILTSDYGLPE